MKRRPRLWFAVLVAGGFLSGCEPVNSLFPLYKSEDSVVDENLLGTWKLSNPSSDEDEEVRWYFSAPSDQKSYGFKWGALGAEGGFLARARLVKLGTAMFIDFEGDESLTDETQKNNLMAFPVISTHMMGRIWLTKDSLEIHFLKDDWVKAQVKAGAFPLANVDVEGSPILTAKTDDLRKFMQAHADDQEALSENYSLVRQK